MTTPAIVPVGFSGNSTDYLRAKVDRSGSAFTNRGAVTVPVGTVATTIVGLVPFQRGMNLQLPNNVVVGALGAGVTMSIGVIYDDNVANTNNQTLWASASTAAAAGGSIALIDSAVTKQFVTTGDGWIAATIGGATTGTANDVTVQFLLDYFTGGIQA